QHVLGKAAVGAGFVGGDGHIHEQPHDAQGVGAVVGVVGVGHQVAGGVAEEVHFHFAGFKAGGHFAADQHVQAGAAEDGISGDAYRGDVRVDGDVAQFRAHVAAGLGDVVLAEQGGVHRYFVHRFAGERGGAGAVFRV